MPPCLDSHWCGLYGNFKSWFANFHVVRLIRHAAYIPKIAVILFVVYSSVLSLFSSDLFYSHAMTVWVLDASVVIHVMEMVM